MRVVFLGSQEIGARCLEVVLRSPYEVVGVGAFKPEEHENWTDDVVRLVEKRGLHRLRGRRFKTRKALDELAALEPDILFAIGWRWILPEAILSLPPMGCLGIHGSLLPRGRGFAPVNWALIRDEPETGPSLFYFDAGVDTGDLVGQRPFPIRDEDDAATVRSRLADASVALLEEMLPMLADGTAPRRKQPDQGGTYGPRRRPEDGAIDWSLPPREVFNWIRGLTRPYPGAFTFLQGRKVFVWKSRPRDEAGPGPGVLARAEDSGAVVGAGTHTVEVLDATYERGDMDDVIRDLRVAGRFDPLGPDAAAGANP